MKKKLQTLILCFICILGIIYIPNNELNASDNQPYLEYQTLDFTSDQFYSLGLTMGIKVFNVSKFDKISFTRKNFAHANGDDGSAKFTASYDYYNNQIILFNSLFDYAPTRNGKTETEIIKVKIETIDGKKYTLKLKVIAPDYEEWIDVWDNFFESQNI